MTKRTAGLFCAAFIAAQSSFLFGVEPGTFHADGNPKSKAVALTFDDGPGKFTEEILAVLEKYNVKATFFMSGDQAEIRPALAKKVAAAGHEIGDHTYSHVNFYAYEKKHGAERTELKVREEMERSKKMIEQFAGVTPKICRMPNGYVRPWLKKTAGDFGYALVNWTFGEDWNPVPEEKMAEDYIKHVRPGSILLMHDGGKDRSKTVKILPKIIEAAQARNLAIVTVSEILKP